MTRSLFFCRKTHLALVILTFISGLLLLSAGPLSAQDEPSGTQDTSYRHVDLSLRYWFLYGENKFKVHGITNTGFQIDADQELSSMETHLAIFTLAFKPDYWLTLEGSWGWGVLTGGDYKYVYNDHEDLDHDYGTLMGDPDDDYSIYCAALYLRIWPWKRQTRHFLDGYVKWLQWSKELEISIQDRRDQLNKLQVPGIFDWREDWHTLWIGAKGECGMVRRPSLGAYQWGFIVDVAFSPYVEVEGRGDYRVGNTGLYTLMDVEGERGYGFMGDLGIFYQPVSYARIQLGLTGQYLKMRDGTAKVVDLNRPGTTSGDFESGQAINYGPYIQGSLRW